MQKSRLLQLLRSFSSKEVRLCRAWLDCSMHNTRTDVSDLYNFLWEMELKSNYISKELAWANMYPKTAYNDGKMRQIIHKLLQAVEQFLTYQQLQYKPDQARLLLLNSLHQRQLFPLLNKSIAQAQKAHQSSQMQNWEQLRLDYELENLHFRAAEQAQRTSPLNLQELSDALDIQYFADKLRKACLLHARFVVFKMDYAPKMLDIVLEQVETLDYVKLPAIGAYYYCYRSLTATENADHYFEQMMSCLKEDAVNFPAYEIRELYLLAINYTIKKINSGSEWHQEKAFELYKTGITEGYLLEAKQQLTPFTYNNMVSLSLAMQQYEWVEWFIHEYKNKVAPEHRESIFAECLARLYYTQKNYKAAQQLLATIEVKDILRLLSCKIILAKIYYETDEFTALESLLDSLKMYLRRKEVVGYHKQNYQNVVYYLQKLARLNPFDKAAKKELAEAITATPVLTTKAWLLEQLELV